MPAAGVVAQKRRKHVCCVGVYKVGQRKGKKRNYPSRDLKKSRAEGVKWKKPFKFRISIPTVSYNAVDGCVMNSIPTRTHKG